ncbi:hypothetical protein TNCV_2889811 [Trichonephila clavipes]|nr:hypothetical protein TNCV_2889811 [Trichonephila clavipes]
MAQHPRDLSDSVPARLAAFEKLINAALRSKTFGDGSCNDDPNPHHQREEIELQQNLALGLGQIEQLPNTRPQGHSSERFTAILLQLIQNPHHDIANPLLDIREVWYRCVRQDIGKEKKASSTQYAREHTSTE